jgi:hypothetical protein
MVRGFCLLIAGAVLVAGGLMAPTLAAHLSWGADRPEGEVLAAGAAARTDGIRMFSADQAPTPADTRLRGELESIPSARKLVLANGDVLAVAALCAADGAARCATLYDLKDLSALTIDEGGAVLAEDARTPASGERLRALVESSAMAGVLRDFLRDAPL